MLASLNPQQKQAVLHMGSPLLILAGPGSGKTRTITTKIAWLIQCQGILPHRILAMTFTNKAANEMKERIDALFALPSKNDAILDTATKNESSEFSGASGVSEASVKDAGDSTSPLRRSHHAFVSTFHSFGYYFMRHFGHKVGFSNTPSIIDDQEQAQLLKTISPSLDSKTANIHAKNIARCKDFGLSYRAPAQELASFFVDAELFHEYEKAKLSSNYVDFSDLILLPYTILRDNQDVQEWIQHRWSWFLIDEYQDTNGVQHQLLRAMCAQSKNVCVVGDDDQSIYKFRGAQVDNILQFSSHYPHTTTIKLEQNYRSSPQIVDFCNALIKDNSDRHGKQVFSTEAKGDKPALATFNNEGEELRFIVDQARETAYTQTSLAIFYRTNAQSRLYEMELQRARIAYGIVGALSFFDRQEIKDAISLIRLYTNPSDALSFLRVANKPARGLGGKTQALISEALRAGTSMHDLRPALQNMVSKKALQGFDIFIDVFVPLQERSIGGCIRTLLKRSGIWDMYEREDSLHLTDRINNLEELISFSESYQADNDGFANYFSQISLDKGEYNVQSHAPVQLMTLHRSKGLEFDDVIICGLEEGMLPLSRGGDTVDDLEEERRLFYVGASRARRSLSLTFCYSRKKYGHYVYNDPSVFLKTFLRGDNTDLICASQHGYSIDRLMGGQHDKDRNDDRGSSYTAGVPHEYDAQGWTNGDKVEHSAYGKGHVREVRVNKGHVVIEVDFANNFTAMFMPKYTRELKKCDVSKE